MLCAATSHARTGQRQRQETTSANKVQPSPAKKLMDLNVVCHACVVCLRLLRPKIKNRSEQALKSNRNTNRTEPLQIDPNHYKSIRSTTNRTEYRTIMSNNHQRPACICHMNHEWTTSAIPASITGSSRIGAGDINGSLRFHYHRC